jgi:hypothetical protein
MVRAEQLDGSHVGSGWAIFHRFHLIEEDEPAEWDGYVELTLDSVFENAGPLGLPFASTFRVVPEQERGPHFPSIVVRVRHSVGLGDGRFGVLVIEDEPREV